MSRLNELFEVIVPIVARHGGHVDKFIGDGLLACSARPSPSPTTPTARCVAACEMARKVNSPTTWRLRGSASG